MDLHKLSDDQLFKMLDEDIDKSADTTIETDRKPPNPVEPPKGETPNDIVYKAIETVGISQLFTVRKIASRVNPEVKEHRHAGYDEPHPVDQVHWGEEQQRPLDGPFSVGSITGKNPRESIPNYNKGHEDYFRMIQTYLDLANPNGDVSDNELGVLAHNLLPRVMKCTEDVRKRFLTYDTEAREIQRLGGSASDTEEHGQKKEALGKIYNTLEDISEYLQNPEDRAQIAMALDKLISLEGTRPEEWYLSELFGIQDKEPVREETLKVIAGLNNEKKIELGFAGIHKINTGSYLLKDAALVLSNDHSMFDKIRDRTFIIAKDSEKKPIVIAGYASPVVKDKEGHRIPLFALRKAFSKFMANPKFRNVMIKHRNAQIGEVIPEYTDSEGHKWVSQVDEIGLFVVCLLRDDIKIARDVIEMIKRGILRSFSIGGEALARKYVCQSQQCWWDVTGLELHEVTVCEEGKNQAAKFILLKSEDVEADVNTLNTSELASAMIE